MEINFAFLVALNTGLCELLKNIIGKSRRLNRVMPLISLVSGVILSITAFEKNGFLIGIAVGLASSGLYSGGKKLMSTSR